MPGSCVAFGCRSGYRNCSGFTPDGFKITFHSFPLRRPEVLEKWIRALHRVDFVPTKYSRVCSRHFTNADFLSSSQDSNLARRRKKHSDDVGGSDFINRHLKPDAVPSIFENVPAYLTSTAESTPRQTNFSSASSRRETEARRLEVLEESFVAEDKITGLSLADIESKLKLESSIPGGFQIFLSDGLLILCMLTTTEGIPKVTGSISVNDNMNVVVAVNGSVIPHNQYRDLCPGDRRVDNISQIVNLMARLKAWTDDTQSSSLPVEAKITMAVDLLDKCLDDVEDDDDKHRHIRFLTDQIRLALKIKYCRVYSPQLLIMSYRLHAASAAAYRVMLNENVLCLPSITTLKKVTRRLHDNSDTGGLNNIDYLKLRLSKLSQFDRNVLVMIDEIYIAKRVEYSRGEIHGLTESGEVASTLLCFMVKSFSSKYRDLVAMYPMSKLTSTKLNDSFKEVLRLLHSVSFNVVAVSVDNAAANRKFFVDLLCGGQLKTSIINPESGQPMYLIFDPVHDLKNVYNNFQSRKHFECPPMHQNLPNGCVANFKNIVDLYNMESAMSLKKAHKLNAACLYPKSIEKTSVKLATSVISESTRDALKYYSTHDANVASWSGTADFLSLIIKLWNVMNVKTSTKGRNKRDYTMDPVRSSLDWKLEFLREFADFLERWEQSNKPGLTHETFLALRQTCLSLADCASYLLDRLEFKYVLLGRIQSDDIESRFGWLRQLSGANYFVSMRQIIESSRKIKAISLLQFSGLSLADIDDAIQTADSDEQLYDVADNDKADNIASNLVFSVVPTDNDLSTIYYVSGAVSRSVVRSMKCSHCKEELVSGDEFNNNDTIPSAAIEFLDSINRGGLTKPSEYSYSLSVVCWRIFEEIKSSPSLSSQLLNSTSQRSLLIKVIDRLVDNSFNDCQHVTLDNYCVKGHDLKNLVVVRLFNCFAKNLVKLLTTSSCPRDSEQPAKKRKIAKLCSQSSV